jgi:hypothetical protein
MRPDKIYALVDPQTHVVRYVGKTKQPLEARYQNHASGNCKGTAAWVHTLSAPPVLILLETGEERRIRRLGIESGTIAASAFAETKWIKRFRRTVINALTRESSPTTWDWLRNAESTSVAYGPGAGSNSPAQVHDGSPALVRPQNRREDVERKSPQFGLSLAEIRFRRIGSKTR